MKLSLVPILALIAVLPALALPEPVAAPAEARELEKRAPGVVQVDNLNYRTCPRTSCTVVGQYDKGTYITIQCYTQTNTTVVNGDARWGKLSNGYWVSLYYVSWTGSIPLCA